MLLLSSKLLGNVHEDFACFGGSFFIYAPKSEKSIRPFSVEDSQFTYCYSKYTFCAVVDELEKLPKSSSFFVLVLEFSVIPVLRFPEGLYVFAMGAV